MDKESKKKMKEKDMGKATNMQRTEPIVADREWKINKEKKRKTGMTQNVLPLS